MRSFHWEILRLVVAILFLVCPSAGQPEKFQKRPSISIGEKLAEKSQGMMKTASEKKRYRDKIRSAARKKTARGEEETTFQKKTDSDKQRFNEARRAEFLEKRSWSMSKKQAHRQKRFEERQAQRDARHEERRGRLDDKEAYRQERFAERQARREARRRERFGRENDEEEL